MWEFLTATANRLSSLDLALVVFGMLMYKLISTARKINRANVKWGILALSLMAFGALGVRVLLIWTEFTIKTGG